MCFFFFFFQFQVRLGRNDTKPVAPGLEELFYRYGTAVIEHPAVSCEQQMEKKERLKKKKERKIRPLVRLTK